MNTTILKKASLKPLALLAVLPLALTGCVSTANENTDPNGEVSLVKSGTPSVCPLQALRIRRKRHHRRAGCRHRQRYRL